VKESIPQFGKSPAPLAEREQWFLYRGAGSELKTKQVYSRKEKDKRGTPHFAIMCWLMKKKRMRELRPSQTLFLPGKPAAPSAADTSKGVGFKKGMDETPAGGGSKKKKEMSKFHVR